MVSAVLFLFAALPTFISAGSCAAVGTHAMLEAIPNKREMCGLSMLQVATHEISRRQFGHDRKITVAQGYGDTSSPERVQRRTEVYSALTKLLDHFWKNGVRAFPTNGLLMGIMRSGGFIPYDRDIDIAILDVDKPKLDKLPGWYVDVGGWPIADVHAWTTNSTHVLNDALEVFGSYPHQSSKAFPLDDFTNFVSVPFYCGEIKVPRGSEHYLDASYGASWKNTMINKCNDPRGEQFKIASERCTWACYEGAMGQPYESAPSRGKIDPAVCANSD